MLAFHLGSVYIILSTELVLIFKTMEMLFLQKFS